MAISARLARSLRDSLGEEGADDVINWMVTLDERRSELQDVLEAWKVTTDSRFAAFEARVDARFAAADAKMEARFAESDARIDARFADTNARMDAGFAATNARMVAGFAEMRQAMAGLEIRFERRFNDLLKWSFVFWCGAVGAVAMLARVLP